MLERYKEGSDLTIMNTFYQYPTTDADGNRISDFLAIVYKDNVTGKKHHDIIKKPEYTFFKTKDGINFDYNHLFAKKEEVEPVTVRYNELDKKIAEITGNLEFYKQNIQSRNRGENRKLHADPNILFSDINIEDYYRFVFGKKYTNNINKIWKAYYDIEVDTRYMAGDFVEMGECPINAISLFDDKNDCLITYLLRDKENPLIAEFEDEMLSGKFVEDDIKKFIVDNIGGEKFAIRYKLDKTRVKVKFFDDEISLLCSFFAQVHTFQPDFIVGWNSSGFDLQYIIARIRALGYEPADIMCDQSWEIKVVKHYVDTRHQNDFAERGDYTFISGNTVWLDQMIQYASRRKSKIGSIKSFKLDDIAHDVASVHKLNYHHITTNIAMLPWLNYKIFTLYNMFDVIAQKCIETKTQDLEYIFAKCLMNNTVYRKGHRQTVYLINRMTKEFDKLGFVIGNNANRWNEEPDKFLGALVGDPLKTTDYSKMHINGVPIWICNNLQDFDYKSLYPSIILEFNIAPNTQIGRIDIPNKVYTNENSLMNPKYSRGGEFIENLVCDNIIEFSKRWLHLAGIMEFLDDWKEYDDKFRKSYSQFGYHHDYNYHDSKLIVTPIYNMGDVKKERPITFGNDTTTNPLMFFKPYKDQINIA